MIDFGIAMVFLGLGLLIGATLAHRASERDHEQAAQRAARYRGLQ